MKKIVWLLMMVVMPMIMMPMVANAAFSRNVDLEDEDELFHRLDQYIARRDEFSSKKEKKLIRMKKKLNLTSDKRRASESLSIKSIVSIILIDMTQPWSYANRGLQLAEQLHDAYYINLNKINRAAVLSTGGFYSQAEDLLLSLNPEDISPQVEAILLLYLDLGV